jgi:GMP synthase-like glutamine amidotransferase
MRLHVFEHDPTEVLGSIADWAALRGHSIATTSWHRGESRSGAGEEDLLIVMGGPMNIHEEDRYPWLGQEKAALDEAIAAGRWCLGVCLGAQLLADRLGGTVTRNAWTEIGWHAVRRHLEADADPLFASLPSQFEVMHWHGDTFSTPPGAILGYSSRACRNQAFRKDRVIGLQCHLEFTPDSLGGLIEAQGTFEGEYVQGPAEFLARNEDFEANRNALFALLDALAEEIARSE